MGYFLHIAVLISVYGMLALAQNHLFGQGGMLFAAGAALAGVGAYTYGIACLAGVPQLLAALLACTAASLLGTPLALPALRLRGDRLLVATLGVTELVRSVANNADGLTGGAAGLAAIPALAPVVDGVSRTLAVAVVAILALVGSGLVFRRLEDSPYGRALRATGEDPEGIRWLGRSPRALRTRAAFVASACSGLAGAILAGHLSYIEPGAFTMWESVLILAMTVVGGAGSRMGAVAGAAILVGLPELMRFIGVPPDVAAPLRQVLFGLCLILVMRVRPGGLLGHVDLLRRVR